MQKAENELAICDANVLIDYVSSDEDIIREMTTYWKKVYVPDCVLREVDELTEQRAKELGLFILETPIKQLTQFKNLSFQDAACLYYVKTKKMLCITNDVALRKACVQTGSQVVWGLEMLLFLVKNKQIAKARIKDIGRKIFKKNPQITQKIYDDFIRQLQLI